MKTKPTKKRPKKTTTTQTAKMKRRVKSTPQFPWNASTTHHVVVSRAGGEKLGLFVSSAGGEFFAAAVAVDGKDMESVQAIMERHKHHVIGDFKTLSQALTAAESYGRRWARRQLAEAEDCTCADIALAPMPGATLNNPLFADVRTPSDAIQRARVVVDRETNTITKNAFGPIGVRYERPPPVDAANMTIYPAGGR